MGFAELFTRSQLLEILNIPMTRTMRDNNLLLQDSSAVDALSWSLLLTGSFPCVTPVPQGMQNKEQLFGEGKFVGVVSCRGAAGAQEQLCCAAEWAKLEQSWSAPGGDSQFGHWAGESQEVKLAESLFLNDHFSGKQARSSLALLSPSSWLPQLSSAASQFTATSPGLFSKLLLWLQSSDSICVHPSNYLSLIKCQWFHPQSEPKESGLHLLKGARDKANAARILMFQSKTCFF